MSSHNNDVDALLNGIEGAEDPSAELKARGKKRLLATIGGATIGVVSASAVSASTGGSVAGGSVAGGSVAGGSVAGGSVAGSASAGTGVAGAATGTAAGAAGATLSVGGGLALSGAALAKPLAVLLLVSGAAFSVPWTNTPSDVSSERPLSAAESSAAESSAAESSAAEPREAEAPDVIPAETTLPAVLVPGEELPRYQPAQARAQESIDNAPNVSPSAQEEEPSGSLFAPTPARTEPDNGATLLRRAVAFQHHGDHAGALRTANTHRARFPNSVLRVEREAVAISALCQLGRDAEARVREQTIRGEQEATYLAQRIRRFCD